MKGNYSESESSDNIRLQNEINSLKAENEKLKTSNALYKLSSNINSSKEDASRAATTAATTAATSTTTTSITTASSTDSSSPDIQNNNNNNNSSSSSSSTGGGVSSSSSHDRIAELEAQVFILKTQNSKLIDENKELKTANDQHKQLPQGIDHDSCKYPSPKGLYLFQMELFS